MQAAVATVCKWGWKEEPEGRWVERAEGVMQAAVAGVVVS